MAFGTRVWSAGKFFVILGALAVTYIVFAAASMRLAIRAREVKVPDLTNRTPNDATAVATELGLRFTSTRRGGPISRFRPVMCWDRIPAAGLTTRRQRSVRVWLSAGPRAASVPVLTGETERASQLRLTEEGLELAGISEIRSPTYASDVVVAQDPAAKSGAHAGHAARQPRSAGRRATSCPI